MNSNPSANRKFIAYFVIISLITMPYENLNSDKTNSKVLL